MRAGTPLFAALACTAGCSGARAAPADAYEQLAALAGEWQADLAGFGKLTNSIRLVSNGKAVEETIGTPADNETSIYTRDGEQLLLTHFCALTPQGHVARLALRPQRSAQEPLEFLFVGASNLPNPDAPHMRRVLITFSESPSSGPGARTARTRCSTCTSCAAEPAQRRGRGARLAPVRALPGNGSRATSASPGTAR